MNEAMSVSSGFSKRTNRYISIILAVLLCFALVSCGNTDAHLDEGEAETQPISSTFSSIQKESETEKFISGTTNPPETTTPSTTATSTSSTDNTEATTTTTTTDATTPTATTTTVTTTTTTTQEGRDYIANKNTKKFHYPSCHSVKQMKESNKWYYSGSRDDLIAQGYSPCAKCKP